ncbi:MAG: mechanosensitive ion channel family protein [Methermicoccaceae archaeon]
MSMEINGSSSLNSIHLSSMGTGEMLIDIVIRLIIAFVILIIAFIIVRGLRHILDVYYNKLIERGAELLELDERRVETQFVFFKRLVTASVYIFALIVIISLFPSLRSISLALLAGAGFAGIVIGLAAQKMVGGLLSGIMLSIFQPFRVGDKVTFRDMYGEIEDINIFYTTIRTWENKMVVVPNYIMSDEVIENWSIGDLKVYWTIDIGISYDSDIDLARKIMLEEAEKHPSIMLTGEANPSAPVEDRGKKAAVVRVHALADSAVVMRLGFWVYDRGMAYVAGTELMEAIKKRFDREGVEIPFPYHTIVYKNDLPSPAKLGEGPTPQQPSLPEEAPPQNEDVQDTDL